MKRFLRQHDFVYEVAPEQWMQGMPLGNGSIGAMVWGGGSPLVLTLERVDLWELRRKPITYTTYNYTNLKRLLDAGDDRKVYDTFGQRFEQDFYHGAVTQTRLTPGRLEVDFGAEAEEWSGRLDLHRATAEVEMRFARGRAKVRCFVDAVRDVIVLSMEARGAVIRSVPSAYRFPNLGYPPEEQGESEGIQWRLQRQTGGAEYAVAWRVDGDARSACQVVYCTVAGSREPGRAVDTACARVRDAVRLGEARLWREHCAWWSAFWSRSFLTVPDAHIENLYYAELYKLGCQAREGHPYPSGQGMWCPDGWPPPWAAQYGFNLNEQMNSWLCFASNHVDAARPLAELLWRWLPVNREICRKFYGVEGATLIHGSDFDGYEVPGWYCANLWAACGPWACHCLWLTYLYTKDRAFLRDRAYPLLRAHMGQYRGILEKGPDGKWHVPRNPSPEWLDNRAAAWGRDDTGNLGFARWLAGALLEARGILGDDAGDSEDDVAWWRDVADHMAPFATDSTGLMLMEGVPLDDSHRTHIQLLPIHPLNLIHCEGDEAQRALLEQSLGNVVRRGMGTWCGYTVSWFAILCARAGQAWRAHAMLKLYADVATSENSFHLNGDTRRKGFFATPIAVPTPEGGFTAGAALLEMLVQSWNGVIRLFPATPACWADAAFDHLRAEGAFLVSARRKGGRVRWVQVQSEVGGTCRIRNPFGGPARLADSTAGKARRLAGPELRFATRKGGVYELVPWTDLAAYGLGPARARPQFTRPPAGSNWYGVKKTPRF